MATHKDSAVHQQNIRRRPQRHSAQYAGKQLAVAPALSHPVAAPAQVQVDFRTGLDGAGAAALLAERLHALGQLLAGGHTVVAQWPRPADEAAIAALCGGSLVRAVLGQLQGACPSAALIIESRGVQPAGWVEAKAAHLPVRFRLWVNAESAALSHEAGEIAPLRRLQIASRLRGAGYQIEVHVGEVYLHAGWREDYEELAADLLELELKVSAVHFAVAGAGVAAAAADALLDSAHRRAPWRDLAVSPGSSLFTVPARTRASVQRLFGVQPVAAPLSTPAAAAAPAAEGVAVPAYPAALPSAA